MHRSLLDNPRIVDPEWLAVWVYLLLSATHRPIDRIFDGRRVTLQPGQLITGRHAIAKKTGVSQSKAWRILETLKSEQQIEQQAGVKGSIITVLNWAAYQEREQQIEQQPSSNRAATEQQASTNNNITTRTREQEGRSQRPMTAAPQRKLTPSERITAEGVVERLRGEIADLHGRFEVHLSQEERQEVVAKLTEKRAKVAELDRRIEESLV